MLLPLQDVLDSPLFLKSRPQILAGAHASNRRASGGCIQARYCRLRPSCGARNCCSAGASRCLSHAMRRRSSTSRALPTGTSRRLPSRRPAYPRASGSDSSRAAEAAGLPLIELRVTVPFVEMAETINRIIVSAAGTWPCSAPMRFPNASPTTSPLPGRTCRR